MEERRKREEILTVRELWVLQVTSSIMSVVVFICGLSAAVTGALSDLALYPGLLSLALCLITVVYCLSGRKCVSYRCTSCCLVCLAVMYFVAQIAINVVVISEAFDVTKYCFGYLRNQCVKHRRRPTLTCEGAGEIKCGEKYQLALGYTSLACSTFGVTVAAAMISVLGIVERMSKRSYVGLGVEMTSATNA